MAQQLITIGVADAKGGDTLFTGATKINENFTEVYDSLGQNNTVYLRSEADLPNKTATTWTMDADIPYKIAADFSTSLQCIPNAGASLRGDNVTAYTLSFTGSGAMFRGTDVDFYINNMSIDPGISNTAFEFDDTVGGVRLFIAENLQVDNCAVWGKFTNMRIAQATNCDGRNCTQGLQFFGLTGLTWSITRLSLASTNSSFIALDLGSAVAQLAEFTDVVVDAPAGAIGLSGLTASGNIPANRLGVVNGCEFLGGMGDLQNITTDDVRWSFRNCNPTQDTQPDALISFKGNVTETIITASSTDGSNAVLVAGAWVESQASHFSTTAAGRMNYIAERVLKGPVDAAAGLISSGGGAITIGLYISVNGSPIVASGVEAAISGVNAAHLSLPWQLVFNPLDYVELYVENQTNTTNIIVDHAILRIL